MLLIRASVIDSLNGIWSSNKNDYYEKYVSNTLGFVAQGSEFGFGRCMPEELMITP